jgi:transcriptional regulator with XRE-family HTH domain
MSSPEDYATELALFLKGFSDNVRGIRTAKTPRWSQERLSSETKLHRTEIGKIDQGKVDPRLSTVFILASALGVSVDDLLVGLRVPIERKPFPRGESW